MKTTLTLSFVALMCMLVCAPVNAETFQYGLNGYTGSEDMFFWENTYGNQGGQDHMSTYDATQYIPVVKFDVSSIAPGTPIGSAVLSIYVMRAAPITQSLTAYPMLQSFGFGVATDIWVPEVGTASHLLRNFTGTGDYLGDPWALVDDGAGGLEPSYGPLADINYSTADGVASTIVAGTSYIEFDVTNLVQQWVDNSTTNNGLIMYNTSGVLDWLGSNETPTQAQRPMLEVTVVPEPATMSLGMLLLAVLKMRKK